MNYFDKHMDIKVDKSDASSLREEVIKILKEAIYAGYLPPGTRLVKSQLANKLQVSRTPVREALLQLEVDGLIESIPNTGVFVKAFSISEVDEIHLIYGALSGVAAGISVERISKSELKQMGEYIAKMERCKDNTDRKEWYIYNDKFHSTLLRPCKKVALLKLIKAYSRQMGRYRYLMLYHPGSIALFNGEHLEIFDAFKKKNPKLVRELIENHVRSSGNMIVESLTLIAPADVTSLSFAI